MQTESTVEYFECSPKSRVYFTHSDALEPLESMDVGKCIALPKEGLHEPLLAEMVAAQSKGKKRFALIEHETVFEVFRLPDNFPADLVRKFSNPIRKIGEVSRAEDELRELVRAAVNKFYTLPMSSLVSYCVGIPASVMQEKLIPYSYLQRKVSCLASFRKYPDGANAGLKLAIELLEKEGFIKAVSKKFLSESHKTNSRCFELVTK